MLQLLECLLVFFSHTQYTQLSIIISPIIYHKKNSKYTISVYEMRKLNLVIPFYFGCVCGKKCVYPFQ